MSVPKSVLEFLLQKQIPFEEINYENSTSANTMAAEIGIPPAQLMRCVILQGAQASYMAVLPSHYLLDFEVVKKLKQEELSVVTGDKLPTFFPKCAVGQKPAFPELFGLIGLIDNAVFEVEHIYLESGSDGVLIKIAQEHLAQLYSDDQRASFACGPEKLYSGRTANEDMSETVSQFTPIRIKQRIDETFDLPAMPEIAQEIMKLRVDPSADAKKLGAIVAKDPSLAAQIISWASSPYYGYKGTVDSVETAISRVLGFDLVMNLALGISIGKSLNIPPDGPLGIHAFWRQAIYSASLVEKLSAMIPAKQRPERGLAYLSGLLHNFGHLLLGHLFPPQFALINRYIEANPGIRIEDIEFFVLGVTHQEIGAWLMKNWHMPDELIVAVRWHHKEEFWSKHAIYSNLVLVSARLLKRIHLGDAVDDSLPSETLKLLALDEGKVLEGFEQLLEERDVLDVMSKQLVA